MRAFIVLADFFRDNRMLEGRPALVAAGPCNHSRRIFIVKNYVAMIRILIKDEIHQAIVWLDRTRDLELDRSLC